MTENASNELKFGPDMYFYGFYQIPEDFWKKFKICRFLAKIGHSARISCPDFVPLFFYEKRPKKKIARKTYFWNIVFLKVWIVYF